MRSRHYLIVASFLLMTLTTLGGCVSFRAPEEVNIGSGHREPVGDEVPPTKNHEEARYELTRAYEEIHYLRRKIASLEEDKAELKRDLHDAKHKNDD